MTRGGGRLKRREAAERALFRTLLLLSPPLRRSSRRGRETVDEVRYAVHGGRSLEFLDISLKGKAGHPVHVRPLQRGAGPHCS
jgi:hypothetical protein